MRWEWGKEGVQTQESQKSGPLPTCSRPCDSLPLGWASQHIFSSPLVDSRAPWGCGDQHCFRWLMTQCNLAVVTLGKGNLENKYLYPGAENIKYTMSPDNLTNHTSELPGPALSAKVREASSYFILCNMSFPRFFTLTL